MEPPKYTSKMIRISHNQTRANDSIAKTYDLNNNNFEVNHTSPNGTSESWAFKIHQSSISKLEDDGMQENKVKYRRRPHPDHTGIWIAFVAWIVIVMSGVIFAGYKVTNINFISLK